MAVDGSQGVLPPATHDDEEEEEEEAEEEEEEEEEEAQRARHSSSYRVGLHLRSSYPFPVARTDLSSQIESQNKPRGFPSVPLPRAFRSRGCLFVCTHLLSFDTLGIGTVLGHRSAVLT